MAIVSRNTKGSALTHAELDGNFADLDNRISTRVDSSTISSMINNVTLDSAKTISIITATVDAGFIQSDTISIISNTVDSDYVQARQTSSGGGGGGLDSATAIALIDSDYVQARQTSSSVAGSDRQIQFNNSGSFGGDAEFTFTKVSTASRVGVGIASASNLYVPGPAGLSNSVLHIHNPTSGNAGSGVKMTRITSGASDSAGLELFIAPDDEGYLYHNQNENIHIATNRITKFTVFNSGGVQVTNRGDLRLGDSDNSHYVGFKAPTTVGTNYIWTLPDSDGSNGHFLKTDGSGNLSFAAGGGGGGSPGGSNTQVQFNDGGSSFGGDAGLVYSKDSDKLTAVNLAVSGTLTTTTAGTPTITANSNLLLKVGGSVVVQADSAGNGAGFRVGTRTTTQRNALSASDGEIIYNSTIGQFDIYQRSAWQPLTKGSAIFNVVNNGSSDWAFTDAETHWFPTSENDPVLYLRRGETYYFVVNASGHPFQIRASNGGSAYTTGVTNNGAAVGTVVFKVPMSAPATLYYQCTNHSGMGNTINIV